MSSVADWLATGLVHGTALAALSGLLAITILRRARPAVLCALWTVVLLKFLVPFGPASDLSLSSALSSAAERLLPGDAAQATAPAASGALAPAPAAAPAHETAPAWPAVLLVIYLAGLALVLARRAVAHRRLAHHLVGLGPAPAALRAQVSAAAARLGLRRAPRVLSDPRAAGPYLAGRLGPVLVLPTWLHASDPALRAAIAHELAHVRRRDPLLALVPQAATALLWFWPPVHWAARRLDRAREMACDQWALAEGPLGARAYARFLVEVAARRAGGDPAPAPALSLLRSRSQLATRVDHLLGGQRPAALGRRPAAALALWAALCLAGAGGAAAASPGAPAMCELEPEVVARLLVSHPGADTDGDGRLSQEEACAHQRRMKRRLLDHVVDAELVSRLDPAADLDGDGLLSAYELDWAKNQIDLGMAGGGGGQLVLELSGGQPVAVPSADIRVSAAEAPAPVCPQSDRPGAGPRCGQTAPTGRAPFLIDVTLDPQETP